MRPALLLLACLSVVACGDDDPPAGDVDGAPADASGCVMTEVEMPNENWVHVDEGSVIDWANEPPASGAHYPIWGRYEVHNTALARGYWVHNLEHGAVVLVYQPGAPAAVIDDLGAAHAALPDDPDCGHRRALQTPDPALTTPVAVIAANWVLSGDCVDRGAVLRFVADHRADPLEAPEDVCADGSVP